jgi:IclR family KDG regulon transcriptional repressor
MRRHLSKRKSVPRVSLRNRNRVQSVQRAIAILRAFDLDTPKWAVTALSAHLNLPKTIVTRLLATLEDTGFVEQDAADRTYYLGRSIYELAGRYANRNELIRIGNTFLVQLVAQTNFTAQLSVLDGKETFCLAASESPMVVRAVFYPGLRRPSHATASGKVLLSGLSDDGVRALLGSDKLPRITSNTIIDIEELLKHLVVVRRQGYATNYGESIDGLIAIAAPVRNYQGQIVAAVSLGFPKQFVTEDQITVLTQHVVKTAQQISQRLGACSKFR